MFSIAAIRLYHVDFFLSAEKEALSLIQKKHVPLFLLKANPRKLSCLG